MAIETERKFLILFSEEDFKEASKKYKTTEIVQTYLPSSDEIPPAQRRVRKITDGYDVTYIYTEKRKISALSRKEDEREISPEEYALLRAEGISEIKKSRIHIPYSSHILEIDVYPAEYAGELLRSHAVLEVELHHEDESIEFPHYIQMVREITGDERYSNVSLAKTL